ncbi:MAG: DUF222 domain-containing protein, partial [Acidimicrobiia bacterium]|nr:DUF222 domain-containing protein [Acidimicrobiia bacterium]
TTDALEQRLLRLESIVAAARTEQAGIVAEIDTRQIPLADGCRSMREWLAGRLGVTNDTARSLARLARSDHQTIRETAGRGELSFDQAVEADRLASMVGEERALDAAFAHDVAGIQRLTARYRRITRGDERDIFDGRHFVMQPNLDRTAYRAWGLLPGIDGSIVEKALFERADEFPARPDATQGPVGQRMADALVSVCQDSLTGSAGSDSTTLLATVFVDADLASTTAAEAGATVAAGPRVGPLTLEEILCGGAVEVITTDRGRPTWSSHAARAIPPAVRRFVLHRDGGACTADGCSSRYRLQPHHVKRRTDGGDHDPANLTTLCWFHHHIVIHRMGYSIDPDSAPRRRRFLNPTGLRGPP